jgi:hypothetical protein
LLAIKKDIPQHAIAIDATAPLSAVVADILSRGKISDKAYRVH